FAYNTTSHTYSRTGRSMATVRACAPVSRDGAIGCTPPTPETPVSTLVPATPVAMSLLSAAGAGVPTTPSSTANSQSAAAAAAAAAAVEGTGSIVVRLTRPGSGKLQFVSIIKTIPGPASATVVDGLIDGQSYDVSVKACNDGGRCSDFTDAQSVKASTASQFTG